MARCSPAARKPGEAEDHDQRAERSDTRRQAAPESLGDPAVRRDHLIDGAADSRQDQADEHEADTGLGERKGFLPEAQLAHGSTAVDTSTPASARASRISVAAVTAGCISFRLTLYSFPTTLLQRACQVEIF